MEKPFESWLGEYLEFRSRATKNLRGSVATDMAPLQQEQAQLEPLLWEAEEHRALAEFYMREAVDDKLARRARRVWALEHSKGLCHVIGSRAMKVAQRIKEQSNKR